jgi:hypothetical protein
MKTIIFIQGTDFFINGEPTYQDRHHEGRRVEGLLLNSRMVQAIFDDENPETVSQWQYPDTKKWDANRNTDEFCAALPSYKEHGLLAVTVGLQGGGPIYNPEIYDHYINSAFDWDGSLKPAYFERLRKILATADSLGLVVIVNYFYWQQNRNFVDDAAIKRATQLATEWLLESGYRNVIIDINNEINKGEGLLESGGIHQLVEIIQGTQLDGDRLLVGTSVHPHNHMPGGKWPELVDFFMPHGNDSPPDLLRQEIRKLKAWNVYVANPRPILINEDSVDVRNLDVAVDEGVSWGYYSQGYGSGYKDKRWDWTIHKREPKQEHLSGFQTPPVNWGINTDLKREFFERVKEITGNRNL